MGNKINAKLGLAPVTKTRQATHGRMLNPTIRCACGSRHVLRTISENGQRLGEFWCGNCGAFFSV